MAGPEFFKPRRLGKILDPYHCQLNRLRPKVIVTVPESEGDYKPPYPLVFMLNGFMCNAGMYRGIVRYVASFGYAIVQCDHAYVSDRNEVDVLKGIINSFEGRAFRDQLDLGRLAVMGHSRGGKLAALQLVQGVPNILTAVLFDPIDMIAVTRLLNAPLKGLQGMFGCKNDAAPFPSVTKLLEEARPEQRIGIVGAAVKGKGIPADEGYRKFWPVLPDGSLLMELMQAGHMQFTDEATFGGFIGNGPEENTIGFAASFAAAWLQSVIRPLEGVALLNEFREWASRYPTRVVLKEKVEAGGAEANGAEPNGTEANGAEPSGAKAGGRAANGAATAAAEEEEAKARGLVTSAAGT